MTLLLDTNVISELRKAGSGRADPHVVTWASTVNLSGQFISAVTLYELARGVALVERRDPAAAAHLRMWLERQVITGFANSVLPINAEIALAAGRLMALEPRSLADCLKAATAQVHNLALVTRNVADFAHVPKLKLLNPWALVQERSE